MSKTGRLKDHLQVSMHEDCCWTQLFLRWVCLTGVTGLQVAQFTLTVQKYTPGFSLSKKQREACNLSRGNCKTFLQTGSVRAESWRLKSKLLLWWIRPRDGVLRYMVLSLVSIFVSAGSWYQVTTSWLLATLLLWNSVPRHSRVQQIQ